MICIHIYTYTHVHVHMYNRTQVYMCMEETLFPEMVDLPNGLFIMETGDSDEKIDDLEVPPLLKPRTLVCI